MEISRDHLRFYRREQVRFQSSRGTDSDRRRGFLSPRGDRARFFRDVRLSVADDVHVPAEIIPRKDRFLRRLSSLISRPREPTGRLMFMEDSRNSRLKNAWLFLVDKRILADADSQKHPDSCLSFVSRGTASSARLPVP